jgi:hypothetical protein
MRCGATLLIILRRVTEGDATGLTLRAMPASKDR